MNAGVEDGAAALLADAPKMLGVLAALLLHAKENPPTLAGAAAGAALAEEPNANIGFDAAGAAGIALALEALPKDPPNAGVVVGIFKPAAGASEDVDAAPNPNDGVDPPVAEAARPNPPLDVAGALVAAPKEGVLAADPKPPLSAGIWKADELAAPPPDDAPPKPPKEGTAGLDPAEAPPKRVDGADAPKAGADAPNAGAGELIPALL